MRFSSISLIATALAAIAGSAIAAPALRPVEKNLFDRAVDIFSRGNFLFDEKHHQDHRKVSKEAGKGITLCTTAAGCARGANKDLVAGFHDKAVGKLQALQDGHKKASRTEGKTDLHNSVEGDLRAIKGHTRAAKSSIAKHGYTIPY